jgi:hypothetical protein
MQCLKLKHRRQAAHCARPDRVLQSVIPDVHCSIAAVDYGPHLDTPWVKWGARRLCSVATDQPRHSPGPSRR